MQITARDGDNFLAAFAQTVGSSVHNGRVVIPAQYGSGYVMGFLFGPQLRVIVRHYMLHDDLLVKRQRFPMPDDQMIQISISGLLKDDPSKAVGGEVANRLLPTVTISTQGLDAEVHIPRGIAFNLIKLAVDPAYLRELLAGEPENRVVKTLLDNRQPLVFAELVSLRLGEIVMDMMERSVPVAFQRFYYKVKVEELICCLLMDLVQRQERSLYSINATDLKALYRVRERLISNLVKAPPLVELAELGGMSLSKLKRLFNQVFGCGPHRYYQTMRMKKAASLLQDKQLSVSEVGYALGFSNLSHFGRVFEEHIGLKPKNFQSLSQV